MVRSLPIELAMLLCMMILWLQIYLCEKWDNTKFFCTISGDGKGLTEKPLCIHKTKGDEKNHD